MTELARVGIRGTGSCLPEKVLRNQDFEKIVDTSDEWIVSRTGIRERHVVGPGESTASLALEAGRRALADAKLAPEEVDVILVATVTPDNQFPSTACKIQARSARRAPPRSTSPPRAPASSTG